MQIDKTKKVINDFVLSDHKYYLSVQILIIRLIYYCFSHLNFWQPLKKPTKVFHKHSKSCILVFHRLPSLLYKVILHFTLQLRF